MVDEEVAAEVRRFKQALRAMARARGGGVLFVETAAGLSGGGGASAAAAGGGGRFEWARLEAVPVPRTVEQDAPLYFKVGRSGWRGGGAWAGMQQRDESEGDGASRARRRISRPCDDQLPAGTTAATMAMAIRRRSPARHDDGVRSLTRARMPPRRRSRTRTRSGRRTPS